MGTAISCTECSQVAGLIQKFVEAPRKHCLFVQLFFVQLFFVQLSFVRRSCVAIVIIDRHVYVLSVHKRVRACAHTEVWAGRVAIKLYLTMLSVDRARCQTQMGLLESPSLCETA